MRLIVAAVGRLKAGPERDLAARYSERIAKAERRRTEESIALAQLLPAGAAKILLDERGEDLSSLAFTNRLQGWRDQGRPAAFFFVGGPDGVADNLREDPDLCLAFGAATWPHQMVRIMLLEQVYRAVTLLAGHPYHRG